jgi:hypothetical protein
MSKSGLNVVVGTFYRVNFASFPVVITKLHVHADKETNSHKIKVVKILVDCAIVQDQHLVNDASLTVPVDQLLPLEHQPALGREEKAMLQTAYREARDKVRKS